MQFTGPEKGIGIVRNGVYVDITESHEFCPSRRLTLHPLVPDCRSGSGATRGGLRFPESDVPEYLNEKAPKHEGLLKQVFPLPCRKTDEYQYSLGHVKG
jgi:hypothetical protein